MNILFFGTKTYDKDYFNPILKDYPNITIKYVKANLTEETVSLAKDYDAICAFVNATIDSAVIKKLHSYGVKLILMRCAGYNNVDLKEAKKCGIAVMNVPRYSPDSVAEHAITLALAANRKIHKAYNRNRENDFSLDGLMGRNFIGKTAGIVGTGQIGASMARICHGFGMKVIGYDKYKNESLKFMAYKSLDEVIAESDLISLHCPLTEDTYHMINKDTIALMKDGVIFVNTSRGGLVDTNELILGIRNRKFGAVGLDVYEEESNLIFENHSEDILQTSFTARLLMYPNVILTSHQGFLTEESMMAISHTTMDNSLDFINKKGDEILENQL